VLLKDNAAAPLCVVMSWHVLPSIGLIVIGVAGMGALQMGVHKLFHGKVLRHSLQSFFSTRMDSLGSIGKGAFSR
jgi:hypothetical protein